MRAGRRNLITAVTGGDFSAGFTGSARLTAPNTAARFDPPNNTALTVALWVYPTQLTAATYYVYAGVVDGTAPGDGWFVLRDGNTGEFQVGYSNGTGYSLVDSSGFSPSINTWYMIYGTFNNLTGDKSFEIRVYDVNGAVNTSTQVGTGFVNASATGSLYVGSGVGGVNPANARIDKFGIWFGAPDPDTLWNSGAGLTGAQLAGAGVTTGLQFYYDLDEASGSPTWPAFMGGATLTATGTVTQQPRAGH